MRAVYLVGVVATVAAHFAYLIYLPVGGFLALRRPRTLALHVPVVLWGLGVVGLHFPCPLTWLEQRVRARGGFDPLPPGGFVDRYVDGVLYPSGGTRRARTAAFTAAGVSWVMLAFKHSRKQV